MLARELSRRSIPEGVYLSRVKGVDVFEIPVEVYNMLRTDSDVRAGFDYRVVAGVDRRVRRGRKPPTKPRRTVEQIVANGLVARGVGTTR